MRKRGERVLGLYEQHNGFRIVEIDAQGKRTSSLFDTEGKAERYKEMLLVQLQREDRDTKTAFEEFKTHLVASGVKAPSIATVQWAVHQFFPTPESLALLTPARCEALYKDVRSRPSETGQPLANDTHRNALAGTKTFLDWCVGKLYLSTNPLAGVGHRQAPPAWELSRQVGNELRIREARAWYRAALALAVEGDRGATAALVALLLGMRAGEIVSRRVRDLDDDQDQGDVLWIDYSKTPAGRRTLEVPAVLRLLLVACCEGRATEDIIFTNTRGEKHWPIWIRRNVHRVCDLAEVPRVTAHSMRGLFATLTAERGSAGHLIAATLSRCTRTRSPDRRSRASTARGCWCSRRPEGR